MAHAPTPGSYNAPLAAHYRVRVRDEVLEVPMQMTIGEKFAVRTATGRPFEAYFGDGMFGEDSLCVLWWLARRANGEPNLSWADHLRQWKPVDKPDDVDLVLIDDDEEGDSPGESEPA